MNMSLNRKIFDSEDHMLVNVRDALLDVVGEFVSRLEDPRLLKILDITLVGSNASYNYTEHSDIDLHIIVNLKQISQSCPEILGQLFNSERIRFNQEYDIEIKDIPVEVYVEDVNSNTNSSGIYSILYDDWIKYPQYVDTEDIDLEPDLSDVIEKVSEALVAYDYSSSVELLINNLYLMRKDSLSREGESGKGNLIFKEVRNRGLLDDLKDKYLELRSKELTINESVSNKKGLIKLIIKESTWGEVTRKFSSSTQDKLDKIRESGLFDEMVDKIQEESPSVTAVFTDEYRTIRADRFGFTDDKISQDRRNMFRIINSYYKILEENVSSGQRKDLLYKRVLSKLMPGLSTSEIHIKPNVGLVFDIEPSDESINKVSSRLMSLGFKEVDRYEDNDFLDDSYIVFVKEINGERVVCSIVYNARDDFAFVRAGYNDEEDYEYFE